MNYGNNDNVSVFCWERNGRVAVLLCWAEETSSGGVARSGHSAEPGHEIRVARPSGARERIVDIIIIIVDVTAVIDSLWV